MKPSANREAVERINEARHELEADICQAVRKLIDKFIEENGVCPKGVYIPMEPIGIIGQSFPEVYVIRGVMVELNI